MHELSLCESVLKIIEDEVARQGFTRVRKVWLEIGELSSAEPEAMRFCFKAVTDGTVANGAELEILRPPGQAWCMTCSKTVEVSQRFDPCPVCGGYQLQVTGGDQLRIKELEVD